MEVYGQGVKEGCKYTLLLYTVEGHTAEIIDIYTFILN